MSTGTLSRPCLHQFLEKHVNFLTDHKQYYHILNKAPKSKGGIVWTMSSGESYTGWLGGYAKSVAGSVSAFTADILEESRSDSTGNAINIVRNCLISTCSIDW